MSALGALILSFAVSSLGPLCLPGWHPDKASPIAVYILVIMGYIQDYRVYVLGIMEKKMETTIMGYILGLYLLQDSRLETMSCNEIPCQLEEASCWKLRVLKPPRHRTDCSASALFYTLLFFSRSQREQESSVHSEMSARTFADTGANPWLLEFVGSHDFGGTWAWRIQV